MDRKVDNKTSEELRLLNKVKSQSQTVGARVPNWLKAKILEGADEMGCTVGEYIAHVMYQHTHGQLVSDEEYNRLKEEYDRLESENTSESNLHEQAIEDIEKVERERDELKEKVDGIEKIKAEKLKLSREKKELEKQLSREKKDLEKQLETAQSEKQKLEERVKEQKDRADQKESNRKSEASKRQMLEQRLQQANEWIKNNTSSIPSPFYPGFPGGF